MSTPVDPNSQKWRHFAASFVSDKRESSPEPVPVPANPVTGLSARKAKLLAELEATKAAQEHVTFLANSLIILDRIYRENEGSEEIRLAAQQATAALTALIDALDRSP